MDHQIAGVRVDVPAGFVAEETMVSFRVPAAAGLADARTSTPIRPNLIVHRRPATVRERDLAAVVTLVRGELSSTVPGISAIEGTDIRFADGATGVLLAYALPAPKGLLIRQLQALRLDGGTVTTCTISTEESKLTQDLKVAYLRALGSTRPA